MTGVESIRPGQNTGEILITFASLIEECPSIRFSILKIMKLIVKRLEKGIWMGKGNAERYPQSQEMTV